MVIFTIRSQKNTYPFMFHQVKVLYLTYGVMYGLGASLAYTPSLAILGHYFKKYLGLVNGIVTAGSSIFTTLIPFLIEYLLRHLGLEGTLRSLAALTAIIMACAILFKPIPCKFSLKFANIYVFISIFIYFLQQFFKMSHKDCHIKLALSLIALKIKYIHEVDLIYKIIQFLLRLEIH